MTHRLIALLSLLLALTGCVAPNPTPDTIAAQPQVVRSSLRFQKEYLLAVGDQVEVSVWRVPEASRVVVVRSDGNISLPLIQDLPAAGLTPRELAQKITEALSTRLVNPQVNVLPQNLRQPMVFVLGDVNAPAAYPLRNASTALQAIAAAGGVKRSGAEEYTSVVRLASDGHLTAIPIGLDADGQPAPYMSLAAMALQTDDIVFVPESGRSQVSRFLDEIVLKPLQLFLTYKLIDSF